MGEIYIESYKSLYQNTTNDPNTRNNNNINVLFCILQSQWFCIFIHWVIYKFKKSTYIFQEYVFPSMNLIIYLN